MNAHTHNLFLNPYIFFKSWVHTDTSSSNPIPQDSLTHTHTCTRTHAYAPTSVHCEDWSNNIPVVYRAFSVPTSWFPSSFSQKYPRSLRSPRLRTGWGKVQGVPLLQEASKCSKNEGAMSKGFKSSLERVPWTNWGERQLEHLNKNVHKL